MKALVVLALLSGCALPAGVGIPTATTSAKQTGAVAGQLFCALATAAGPLVVAAADAGGVPIIVSGMAAAVVQADCALLGPAIPVVPPANIAGAPVVALPTPTAPGCKA